MWAQNVPLKSIKETVREEGFDITDYDFAKICRQQGLTRRADAGFKASNSKKRKFCYRAAPGTIEGEDNLQVEDFDGMNSKGLASQPSVLSPEEQLRRDQRLAQIQAESDERLRSRKRRRRIRGFGHLPPDAPGLEPRYGSETSLDESKAYLQLNNPLYVAVRTQYDNILSDMDIERKKTALDDGRWQASKDRLVRENMHLSAVMHPLQAELEKKAIALDVICMDVSKRRRSSKTQLTIAQASNALGFDPRASKDVRRAFYDILEKDQYTTRLACGDEHFEELRQQWFAATSALQAAVERNDPHLMKCIELLARDACKRYKDDKIKEDPSRKNYRRQTYGPGPGAAAYRGSGAGRAATKSAKVSGSLDPALQGSEEQSAQASIPAYFRLSSASTVVGNHPRMWMGKLTGRTVSVLTVAATCKAGAAKVSKLNGIVKNADGTEDSYLIGSDEELDVYLEAAGETPTFVVALEGGYA